MPHSNGRIYIDTTTTPHQGIDVQGDIAKVLGRNTGDVGQLCKDVYADGTPANRINPDALFRPYELSTPGNPNQQTGGPNGDYGRIIPFTRDNLIDIYRELWGFRVPQTFFRALDFNEYDHTPRFADNPWGMTLTETSTTFYCNFTWDGPDRFTSPRKMSLFQDCYMSVAIYASDSQGRMELRYAVSSNTKISVVSGALIQIVKSAVDLTPGVIGGTVVLIPFISEYQIAATTNIEDTTGIGKWNINYNSPQYVYLEGTAPVQAPYTIRVTSLRRVASNVIQIGGTVTNETQSSQNVLFYALYRMYEGLNGTGDVFFDAMTYTSGVNPQMQFTLAAGASQEFTMNLTNGQGTSIEAVQSVLFKLHSPSDSTVDIQNTMNIQ